MRPFEYRQVSTPQEAVATRAGGEARDGAVQFLAGGTTLIDLMKLEVMQPETLADLSPLAETLGQITAEGETLRIGALARMSDAARHPAVTRDYPALAQSLLLAASGQLRNMASIGGNLLQRTRCQYFRDPGWEACNKRKPGSGCAARGGVNRDLAILGTSEHCIANYPGDLAVALLALDARVEILGEAGPRAIPIDALFRPPGETPHIETTLAAGELITAIVLKPSASTRRSLYLKIRDRESYQFALASAAVALDLQGGAVQSARIALGGIATTPWRAEAAEAVITGKPFTEELAAQAADTALSGSWTGGQNAFKQTLARNTLIRALIVATKLETDHG
jgi:xanthine dehydrogenase YagS FAD-binding subunit